MRYFEVPKNFKVFETWSDRNWTAKQSEQYADSRLGFMTNKIDFDIDNVVTQLLNPTLIMENQPITTLLS